MTNSLQFLRSMQVTDTDLLTFAYDYELGHIVCFFEYQPDDGRMPALFIGIGEDVIDAYLDAIETCAATGYHHLINDTEPPKF